MTTLKTEIERKLPKQLFQVLASIGFWNQEGERIYKQNISGEVGSKASQERSRRQTCEDFVFENLLIDIESLSKSNSNEYWIDGYKFGKGGSHIWVSNEKNERILFIHF